MLARHPWVRTFHSMRPITKIFLLAVVAFIVYLIWPRNPDIKGFDPAVLAGLDVKTWVAEKRDKGFDALKTRFTIYSSQYKFPPVPSYRIAQSEAGGIKSLKKALSRADAPDVAEENRATMAFTQKYVTIKKQTGAEFSPDVLAREEVGWRMLELGGSPSNEVAAPIARILAAIYGGEYVDYETVALDIAAARSLIFGETIPDDVTDPVQTAEDMTRDALSLLKELATQSTDLPQDPE